MIGTEIGIKFILEQGVETPTYETSGSSGFDIRAKEDRLIPKGGWALVKTGIKAEIPRGYELQVRSRSGLSFKQGVFVLNSPGTIDADYRGEIGVILANLGGEDFEVDAGDRIAQLVLAKVEVADISTVTLLTQTERGEGGFGSTGVK